MMKPYNAGDDPGVTGTYESDERQCRKDTATAWALHVNFPPEFTGTVLALLNEMLALQESGERDYGLVGRYLDEGDSWEEWGEPSKGDHDHHFVVYFSGENTRYADQPDRVWWLGSDIATHIYMRVIRSAEETFHPNLTFAVSTAGDFAEQVKP